MPRVPKITSLQYLKETVKDEVDFLSKDKRQRFLQTGSEFLEVSIILFDESSKTCPNYPR